MREADHRGYWLYSDHPDGQPDSWSFVNAEIAGPEDNRTGTGETREIVCRKIDNQIAAEQAAGTPTRERSRR